MPYRNQPLSTTFALHEKEKKCQYNQRVIQVEHGSFTSLVFSAYGGAGRETHHFLSTLINHLAEKSDVSIIIIIIIFFIYTGWLLQNINTYKYIKILLSMQDLLKIYM